MHGIEDNGSESIQAGNAAGLMEGSIACRDSEGWRQDNIPLVQRTALSRFMRPRPDRGRQERGIH
jgi:hypothetical protein